MQVYPRVYGGTREPCVQPLLQHGLSPRVRGNLCLDALLGISQRSIPACTGEPSLAAGVGGSAMVYPRVYGGTAMPRSVNAPIAGLSPRVRGNLGLNRTHPTWPRSIPACTGEPEVAATKAVEDQVYPRVYGGTSCNRMCAKGLHGLSPRVRGNPLRPNPDHKGPRSIPACTGEPSCPRSDPARRRVYPRVYGGTRWSFRSGPSSPGLSPRVRGNPKTRIDLIVNSRSIPACTGEPQTAWCR